MTSLSHQITSDLYTVWWETSTPISSSNVSASMSHQHSRHTHSSPIVQQSIAEVWNARKAGNTKLFNGTKFRLGDLTATTTTDLHLRMSVTDYASYLGTNWNKSLQPSILQRKHMADTLGVGAVVVTSDQYIIFIKRSEHVGEFPNCLDVPGGHPEPSRVTGCHGTAWEYTEEKDVALNDALISSNDLVSEFFNSIVDEVYEEINIPKNKLNENQLLMIMRQTEPNGKPSAVFQLACELTKEEVEACYAKGPEEAFESTALVFMSTTDVQNIPVNDMRKDMTPACIGSLLKWREVNE